MPVEPVIWDSKKGLSIIDQTLLPTEYQIIQLETEESVWNAIRTLQVRGAPAIGVCAAFGLLVSLRQHGPFNSSRSVCTQVHKSADYLATSRPTAVNLFWALDQMKTACDSLRQKFDNADELIEQLEQKAIHLFETDKARCRMIGIHGATLIKNGDGVLTHCNAGALATPAYGTALSVMFRAWEEGKHFSVYVDETRPLLQGARLTTWELQQEGIPTTLICDNMAAQLMREQKIQLVVTGADRIASNGDTANKIGTYSVAVCAKAHGIPFYIAAPFSTVDTKLKTGEEIPIEQRPAEEITRGFGKLTAPENVQVYNPAFDVTPAELITGIITEKGILKPPYREAIEQWADNEISSAQG